MKTNKLRMAAAGTFVVFILCFQNCSGGFQSLSSTSKSIANLVQMSKSSSQFLLQTSQLNSARHVVPCTAAIPMKNNAADASDVIQSCFDRAQAGDAVELAPGTYRIAKGVFLRTANVIFRTAGKDFISAPCTDASDCAMLKALPAIDGHLDATCKSVTVNGNAVFIGLADGIGVDHIIFDGDGAERRLAYAFNGNYTVGMTCSSCTFTNNIAQNGYINGAVNFNMQSHDNAIVGNIIRDTGLHTEHDNYDGHCGTATLQGDGLMVYYSKNTKILSNLFANNTDVDMIILGCPGCEIQNNLVQHTGDLDTSSYGAMHMGRDVDYSIQFTSPNDSHQGTRVPNSAIPYSDTGNFTGADISGNTVDCGPNHACGYGLLLGVFGGAQLECNSPVHGGDVHDNHISNAQQGVEIDLAVDIKYRNNVISNSGSKTLYQGCYLENYELAQPSQQWGTGTSLNIAPEIASRIDRTGDSQVGSPMSSVRPLCSINADTSLRALIPQSGTLLIAGVSPAPVASSDVTGGIGNQVGSATGTVASVRTNGSSGANNSVSSGNTAVDTSAYDTAITGLFQTMLARVPTASELAYYRYLMVQGTSAGQIEVTIGNSPEYYALAITNIYQTYVHRAPDSAGMAYFMNCLQNLGWSFEQVRQAIASSPEAQVLNH